ncbi:PREDICTED: histone-lysine N-methyltransferase SETMAR-like [Dinoponera quadriceps]|uniref:Histone-lysine N-methyltransferase SETMAR-like n=1 Tax=Dinoponera quadriceps TaxID=609295 RepID=A0A6P3XPI4_DINQU|nr:PREDICTED: histone-lysine N-methyltransferase SETMAR-like [Dinoponera quadriceps]
MEQLDKQYFPSLMLFFFRKGKSATQAKKKICATYGNDAVTERMCQKWFKKFRAGDTTLEDEDERSVPPVIADDNQIKTLIENNQRYTTQEIAEILHLSHTTVIEYLQELGYVNRFDLWVPHDLPEENLVDRISICDSLLKRNTNSPFLKRIVTGDETWIIYNNAVRKQSQGKCSIKLSTAPKAELHPQKAKLCIWWDWKGVIYYELLPKNVQLNSNKYCAQLDKLKEAIAEKRPELINRKGVLFHQDNAKPHICLITQKKILQLGWDVLPHPIYSPDVAPSNYYLFRSLQNFLNDKAFASLEDCKEHLQQFFAEKTPEYYAQGIMQLPIRWQKVIENKGCHIND